MIGKNKVNILGELDKARERAWDDVTQIMAPGMYATEQDIDKRREQLARDLLEADRSTGLKFSEKQQQR